jgi:LysR family transcriptional regulator, low CO2-responsive transcriptional regulator
MRLELGGGLVKLLEVDGLPLVRLWHIVNLQAKLLSPAAEALRYFVLEKGQEILARGPKLAPCHGTAATALDEIGRVDTDAAGGA